MSHRIQNQMSSVISYSCFLMSPERCGVTKIELVNTARENLRPGGQSSLCPRCTSFTGLSRVAHHDFLAHQAASWRACVAVALRISELILTCH